MFPFMLLFFKENKNNFDNTCPASYLIVSETRETFELRARHDFWSRDCPKYMQRCLYAFDTCNRKRIVNQTKLDRVSSR